MLHIGSYQNDVWFAQEDEEENDGYFGVFFFPLVAPTLNGGS